MSKQVTFEFLEAKARVEIYNAWAKEFSKPRAADGNINYVTDNVLKFTQYNFLKCAKDDIFDGHYTIYINYKTFQYVVYQSSYYGSLTYTTESNDQKIYNANNLPEISKTRIEAIIAHKLLCTYISDNDVEGGRINLIEGSRYGQSLLCDYRGYVWCDFKIKQRTPMELEILAEIDTEFSLPVVKDVRVTKLGRKQSNKNGWGLECFVEVNIDNIIQKLTVIRIKSYGLLSTKITNESGRVLTHYSFSDAKSFGLVRKLIPQILTSI